MGLHLVESYDDSETLLVAGRTFPVSCLLEDDEGLRFFLVRDLSAIPVAHWARAGAAGAGVLIAPGWAFVTTEDFLDGHKDNLAARTYTTTAPIRQRPEWPTGQAVYGRERKLSGFVHLHTHSEYSALDGYSTVPEIADAAAADNQPALGLADHGICAGHPDLFTETKKRGMTAVPGLEAYFQPDRFARGQEFRHHYWHLCLFATTQTGLKNLWAMSTESFRDGYYDNKARLDWSTLERHAEGIVATTACLRGPLSDAILRDDEAEAERRLARLLSIFGENLYLEIHANGLAEQKKVNEALVAFGQRHSVPLLAAVDSHYPTAADYDAHEAWVACQINQDVNDEKDMFAVNMDLYVQTEAEVRDRLAYLGPSVVDETIASTVAIASRAECVLEGTVATPTYVKSKGPQGDVEKLLDLCMANWHKTQGKRESQSVYMARFEREMTLLIAKLFCGYYLYVQDYVLHAKNHGVLVGPGRGSGGGSLVAYLSRITEIDPVEHDLLFERFMTEGRTALPDFDVDFGAAKRGFMQDYLRDTWGEEFVVRVGTVTRLQNKGVIENLERAWKSKLPEGSYMDLQAVRKIIDEAEASTAGLGLDWETLWAQEGDVLEPYRARYPEFFAMAGRLVGRVKTYSKHAAGMVISAEGPLTDSLPLRGGDDGESMVAQFPMEALEEMGLVKYDILTIRTLDTIQVAVDLIRERRGITVSPYEWGDGEYSDPHVWAEVSAAHTLGIFQIETSSGTRLTRDFQPTTLAELADMITLVRPGPMRSGLTDTYLRRRAGIEPVSFPDPRLETVLAKTYGTMLYQEDIMAVCMVLAGYDSNEADAVRKILGKKQVEKVAAAGQKFVAGCAERGMPREVAEALWAQMAEFAKYSFNRAHAFAYAMVGYWCAWLKFHYPVEFLTAALSTVDKDRIPSFIKEARRMGYKVLPPDINESGIGFTAYPLMVRYGFDRVPNIGEAQATAIVELQPFESWSDFLVRAVEPKGSKVNMGTVKHLARVGAFDSLVPNRRGLQVLIQRMQDKDEDRCVDYDPEFVSPYSNEGKPLPCHYDWANEPPILGRTNKPLKAKPPPAKCTKACRRFRKVEPFDPDSVEPYSPVEIRKIESEILKTYLSSSPFDVISADDRRILDSQFETMVLPGNYGNYVIAAVLTEVRTRKDRAGRTYAWLTLATDTDEISAICHHRQYETYAPMFKLNTLALLEVTKNDRGFTLEAFRPLSEEVVA